MAGLEREEGGREAAAGYEQSTGQEHVPSGRSGREETADSTMENLAGEA